MDSLIWFIDARFSVSESSISKVALLSSSFQQPVKIIIDARDRGIERWYWPDWADKQSLAAKIEEKNAEVTQAIVKRLLKKKLEHSIVYTKSDDYLATVSTSLRASTSALLIVEDQIRTQRHPIFQVFQKIPSPILLLTQQHWNKPVNILAAVDPLHQHARPGDLDERITIMAKRWGKRLSANWKVVHCCYVSPVFIEHKKRITAIHAEGFSEFVKKLSISKDKTVLLQGNAEFALPKWIKNNDIHLLILGLVARNRVEQFFVGSTTCALLDEPPCDMLLLPDKAETALL